jgi:hypothetical protein
MRIADCGSRHARGWLRRGAGLALLAALLAPALAAAHGASPLREETAQAGPYSVLISTYSLPRTDQVASLTVAPQPGSPVFTRLRAELRPVGTTNSTPRRLEVRPDPADGPGVQEVIVTANVVGAWSLHLALDGSSGPATVDVPVAVAGPPPIPVWLGWLIGLAPLYCGILFVIWQVRDLRRRGALAPLPGG